MFFFNWRRSTCGFRFGFTAKYLFVMVLPQACRTCVTSIASSRRLSFTIERRCVCSLLIRERADNFVGWPVTCYAVVADCFFSFSGCFAPFSLCIGNTAQSVADDYLNLLYSRVSTTPGNSGSLFEFVWSSWKFCIKCRWSTALVSNHDKAGYRISYLRNWSSFLS